MNRIDLQKIADERITEAKVLLDAGKWSGAYYLAGYDAITDSTNGVLPWIKHRW